MQPLSAQRAKPLVPTLDLPQLAWVLASVKWAGARFAWVNAHSHAEAIRQAAVEAARGLDLELRMSFEPRGPIGTAGALRRLSYYLTERFLVANADVATDAPIGALVDAHEAAGAPATLLALPVERTADLVVESGRVAGLVDRRVHRRPGHRYGGIGVFEPGVLEYIPEGPSGLFETVLTGLLRDGAPIAAFEWSGYWLDVGTPEAHLAVNLDALSGALDHRGVPLLMLEAWEYWNAECFVGEEAQWEEAELRRAVVGRRARIAPGTSLERCVVWDGASVPEGEYRNAVVTPRGVVQLGAPGGGGSDNLEGNP